MMTIARPCAAPEAQGRRPASPVTIFQAYLIHCLIDGKVYIGITSRSLRARWNEHLYESRRGRSRMTVAWAIAKHGAENFRIEALCCALSWEGICTAERTLIAQYDCIAPRGYNLRQGGEGAYGRKPTPDAIERSAAKHRGKPCHPNTRAAAVRTHKGKPKSAEARSKMGAARRGRRQTPTVKAKLAAYWAARRERGDFKTETAYAHHRGGARS